ncbi:MAG: hypothetical protein ABWZ62_02430 [Actinomycetota bacterium]
MENAAPGQSPNRSSSSWLRRAASTVAAVGVSDTCSIADAWSALARWGVGGCPSAKASTPAMRWRPSMVRVVHQNQARAAARRRAVSTSRPATVRSSAARRLS